ncbi:quinone oxidoreductase family protein [Frigidibacter mobilis]|uniref:NADPH:quinone reductase n=1 Tax=Frigidibacter mobilis TaxID=1335048 RepID=A0A159Z7P5_9RHOB|nr:quinone oxidoreductase [Frigidibacter mobilis]AMY71451.1 NADPH:quinone reductase [Frigidibacter mobilis]
MTDQAYAMAARRPGGSDMFHKVAIATLPEPGPGQVRIRHTAVGVNFLDVYYRGGSYPWPVEADLVTGSEGAGVVEAVGAGVTGFAVGQRVAYTTPNGAYATHRLLDAALLVPLPDDIPDEIAAAVMLKGLTAHYLLHHSFPVEAGQTVLFHAAAGGVGLIAGQWLAAKGVRAIGTAGGPEKCALALQNGYEAVIDYRAQDFVAEVGRLTGGKGVAAVYDSVGADTIMGSLDALERFGTLVSFGQSSGTPDQLKIKDLTRGSLRVTRPTLFHHVARRDWLLQAAADLFGMIRSGRIVIRIDRSLPLQEVAEAHDGLEGRRTTGSTVLIP